MRLTREPRNAEPMVLTRLKSLRCDIYHKEIRFLIVYSKGNLHAAFNTTGLNE